MMQSTVPGTLILWLFQLIQEWIANSTRTKADIFNTPGPLSEYRLSWVDLPFEGIAVGAVILMPRFPQNTTQAILTCSIGAGWGLSTMNYTSSINEATTQVLSQVDIKAATNTSQKQRLSSDRYLPGASSEENLNRDRTVLYYPPIFPERPIAVTEDWARYLNPSIEYLNTTVFGILMGLNATSPELDPRTSCKVVLKQSRNPISRVVLMGTTGLQEKATTCFKSIPKSQKTG
ncbi:hypothetical protein BDR22DRAFT_844157 [Usnea florida]